MRATSWVNEDVRRVTVIVAGTAIVMLTLVFARPFHGATAAMRAGEPEAGQPATTEKSAAEAASFVSSPTIDTRSEFFIGCGDGSNGYFGEQPKPVTIRD